MNIDQLKYFVDLAKTNSITTTAKRMFISQQALSESIKRLENELGCTLLSRSKTGIEFTDDGKMVLDYARNILEQHLQMEQNLQMKYNKNHLQGKLSIGVGPTVCNTFLPQLILKMHRQYPAIKLHVLEHSRDTILSLLRISELDFGLLGIYKNEDEAAVMVPTHKHLSVPLTFDNLQLKKLYSDPIVCVMSKNHPLSAYDVLNSQQLSNEPQTNYGTGITPFTFMHSPLVSTNAKIHQQFILEENLVCCMPYQAYLSQFNDRNFTYRSIIDYPPVINYLIYRNSVLEENEILYTRFIETALSVVTEL